MNPGHGYAISDMTSVGLAILYDDNTKTCPALDEKRFQFTWGENTSGIIDVDFSHDESSQPDYIIAIRFRDTGTH